MLKEQRRPSKTRLFRQVLDHHRCVAQQREAGLRLATRGQFQRADTTLPPPDTRAQQQLLASRRELEHFGKLHAEHLRDQRHRVGHQPVEIAARERVLAQVHDRCLLPRARRRRGFRARALRHVAQGAGENPPLGETSFAHGEIGGEERAVASLAHDSPADADDLRLTGAQVVREITAGPLPVRRGHEHVHVLADHFRRAEAKQALCRRVCGLDPPAFVDRDDRLDRGLQDRSQPLGAVRQVVWRWWLVAHFATT